MNHILPDEYLISIEKDGYYLWEKSLTIKSQQTTFAEDVILFAKEVQEVVIESAVKAIEFSPNKKFAVFVKNDFDQDYLYLLNLNNEKLTLIYNDNRVFSDPEIIWADDESKFVFQADKTLLNVPTLFPKNYEDLSVNIFRSYSNLKFHNDKIYAIKNNSINVLRI